MVCRKAVIKRRLILFRFRARDPRSGLVRYCETDYPSTLLQLRPQGALSMDEPQLPQTPGMHEVGIPPRFRGHPLLNAAPYFTLPGRLLQQVVAEVGETRFDAGLLEMERALSDVCGDHSSRIGFWGGQPDQLSALTAQERPRQRLLCAGNVQVGQERGGGARDTRHRRAATGLDHRCPPRLLRMADDQSGFPG